MRVLMVSTDRNIFKRDSQVRRRMVDYGSLVEELHIVVFSKQGRKEKISDNAWVYSTNSLSRWFYITDAVRVGREVVKDNFLKIHKTIITTQDPFETGVVGWWLGKKFAFPLQLQIHTDLFSPYFGKEFLINRIRLFFARFLIPRAGHIRVVSERIKNSLKARSKNKKLKISVLPIFVDIQKIKNAVVSIDLHKKYPDKKIVLMASRPTVEKNIPLAERAIKEVVKKYPEVFLFRVSDASFKELMSYYKTADMFLLTSNFEGYGMVLVEASSVGLPIVSTDVGVAGEIKGAKVVGVGDEKALAQALEEQIKNPVKTEPPKMFSYKDYLEEIKRGWEVCLRVSLEVPQSIEVKNNKNSKSSNGMKLLFITQKVDKDDDVLGVYHRWIERLAEKFESISVICLYRGRVEMPSNVKVFSLGKESGPSRFKYIKKFYKYLWQLRGQYNRVFVHMNPEYMLLGGLFWRFRGQKVGFWYNHPQGDFLAKVGVYLANIVFYTSSQAYMAKFGKSRQMPVGVDTDFFKYHNQGVINKILFLGRMSPIKNIDVLVRSANILGGRGIDFSLDIVGEPTGGKKIEYDYYTELKNLARGKRAISFLPAVPYIKTLEIYREHGVFVNLTTSGSFDKTIFEAMASGLLVVSSNKSFKDLLDKDLQELLVFQEKDERDLVEKLSKVLELSKDKKNQISKKLREIVVARHSLEKLVLKLSREFK